MDDLLCANLNEDLIWMKKQLLKEYSRRRNRNERPEVIAELATKHHATVVRVVYLAQHKLDQGVVAIEIAKTIACSKRW